MVTAVTDGARGDSAVGKVETKTKAKAKASGKRRRRRKSEPKPLPMAYILEQLNGIRDIVLEQRTMPWETGRLLGALINGATGREYEGVRNIMSLKFTARKEGWEDSRFVTFGFLHAMVKEGYVLDWSGQTAAYIWVPKERARWYDDGGNEVKPKRGAKEGDVEVVDLKRQVNVYWDYFPILNAEQVKGVDELLVPLPEPAWLGENEEEMFDTLWDSVTVNFKTVPQLGVVVGDDVPHYTRGKHEVFLPPSRNYLNFERRAESMIHELCHATGFRTEIGRHEGEGYIPSHDRTGRSIEEMAVEFATSVLMGRYGIKHVVERDADYIRSWYTAVNEDEDLLGLAMSEAVRMVNYITLDNPVPLLEGMGIEDEPDAEELEVDAAA